MSNVKNREKCPMSNVKCHMSNVIRIFVLKFRDAADQSSKVAFDVRCMRSGAWDASSGFFSTMSSTAVGWKSGYERPHWAPRAHPSSPGPRPKGGRSPNWPDDSRWSLRAFWALRRELWVLFDDVDPWSTAVGEVSSHVLFFSTLPKTHPFLEQKF